MKIDYTAAITPNGAMEVIAEPQLYGDVPKSQLDPESQGFFNANPNITCQLFAPDAEQQTVQIVLGQVSDNIVSEHCHWVVLNPQHVGQHILVVKASFGNVIPLVNVFRYEVGEPIFSWDQLGLYAGGLAGVAAILSALTAILQAIKPKQMDQKQTAKDLKKSST